VIPFETSILLLQLYESSDRTPIFDSGVSNAIERQTKLSRVVTRKKNHFLRLFHIVYPRRVFIPASIRDSRTSKLGCLKTMNNMLSCKFHLRALSVRALRHTFIETFCAEKKNVNLCRLRSLRDCGLRDARISTIRGSHVTNCPVGTIYTQYIYVYICVVPKGRGDLVRSRVRSSAGDYDGHCQH